ncbi:hypothetical protein JHK85_003096 [Glycine max]|uniref:Phytochrome A-associated F-box protein n=1 Tax=Glycine soja TaxID=3848 RepID=A0A445LIC8_GLYSO|nr:hypothetical protein JHK85_003096 [Glycine max]RZC22988.1 Phytochrome A-associated F-box protein [Glycine soja]
MEESVFAALTDDIVLSILAKLDDDPRHWARAACVSTRFSTLIRHFCWKTKCSQTFPSSLISSDSPSTWSSLLKLAVCCPGLRHAGIPADRNAAKRMNICRNSHLAGGYRHLRREQGCKLLARQFRDDNLFLCDWPGCVHSYQRRDYMLFRGFFHNFKASGVWRSISDEKRRKIDVECAFCTCQHTWDLQSAFCLRRGFGYHLDGEPVVRAYVCENGHVSGAWTNIPLRLELDLYQIQNHARAIGIDEILLFAGDYSI